MRDPVERDTLAIVLGLGGVGIGLALVAISVVIQWIS